MTASHRVQAVVRAREWPRFYAPTRRCMWVVLLVLYSALRGSLEVEVCQTVLYHRKGYSWGDILVISVSVAYSRLPSSKMGADETDWSRMQHETNGNSSFISSIATHSSFHRLHSHVPEISSKFSRFSKLSIFAFGLHDHPKQKIMFRLTIE